MSRIRRVSTETAPLPTAGDATQKRAKRPEGGYRLAGVGWVLITALVLLAALVVGSAVFAGLDDVPGPTTGEIAAHVVGAAVGLALQRCAGRARLPVRVLALLGIAADLGLLLWFYWWA